MGTRTYGECPRCGRHAEKILKNGTCERCYRREWRRRPENLERVRKRDRETARRRLLYETSEQRERRLERMRRWRRENKDWYTAKKRLQRARFQANYEQSVGRTTTEHPWRRDNENVFKQGKEQR